LLNKFVFIILCFFNLCVALAQNCDLKLAGIVKDAGNGETLEFVNIYIKENSRGVSTDGSGIFKISNLCAGHLHLVVSHIGCTTQFVHVDLASDTALVLYMDHSKHKINDIIVKGERTVEKTLQSFETINIKTITDNNDLNLGSLLTKISGVSALKSGGGNAKPIIHGLFANRITILNNEVPQAGQQWGFDHSPEIDPLSANNIQVIKGTAALAYPGSKLGGVVLLKPSKIPNEPHLHGEGKYFYESNGLGNGLHLKMEQHHSKIAWRLSGTLKKRFDQKTPNYFLTNTGAQEANLALQLEKNITEKWFVNFYGSTYNTDIAILLPSHANNFVDLQNSIDREVPYITEFTTTINPPRQQVNHHLIKLNSKYFFTNKNQLAITLTGQLNRRKEFDIRRGGDSHIPIINLKQFAWLIEGKYKHQFSDDFTVKTGAQLNIIDNKSVRAALIIPNYLAYESGLFALLNKGFNNTKLELGLRYDNVLQNVVGLTIARPKQVFKEQNNFNNFSGSFGWKQQILENFNASFNIGYATRNPAINELYIFGRVPGISGIIEGTNNLVSEQSVKTTLGLKSNFAQLLNLEVLLYYQHFDNYIYYEPRGFRLTIDGGSFFYKHLQTDAQIYGLDFSAQLKISESLKANFTYSYLKGDDLSRNLPLIYMPPNNIAATIQYEFFQPIKIFSQQLENVTLSIDDNYTFEQTNYPKEIDFTPPPAAYNLVNFKAAADLQMNKTRWHFTLKVDNLFNTSYRNYLNLQRFFADELGRNVVLGVGFKF